QAISKEDPERAATAFGYCDHPELVSLHDDTELRDFDRGFATTSPVGHRGVDGANSDRLTGLDPLASAGGRMPLLCTSERATTPSGF
ncbi:MAG: hypothetical protein ABUL69_00275, partial [Peristeroidobacter soli]